MSGARRLDRPRRDSSEQPSHLHGMASVGRSDTEIFPRSMTLWRLTSMAQEVGLRLLLISLPKISNELFQTIRVEGYRTT